MAQATTTTRRRAGRLTAMPRLTRVTLALALLVGAGGPTEGAMHHERQASVEEPGRPPAVATTEALPAAIGAWTRAGEAKRVGAGAIFDYMDGAGELYLAYRFDHLEVVEYRAGEGDEILVELYRMRGADDAFGLLSGDWGGEPVALGPAAPDGRPRALYGAGLLRLAAGGTYARVMATRETPASREAVLALGPQCHCPGDWRGPFIHPVPGRGFLSHQCPELHQEPARSGTHLLRDRQSCRNPGRPDRTGPRHSRRCGWILSARRGG